MTKETPRVKNMKDKIEGMLKNDTALQKLKKEAGKALTEYREKRVVLKGSKSDIVEHEEGLKTFFTQTNKTKFNKLLALLRKKDLVDCQDVDPKNKEAFERLQKYLKTSLDFASFAETTYWIRKLSFMDTQNFNEAAEEANKEIFSGILETRIETLKEEAEGKLTNQNIRELGEFYKINASKMKWLEKYSDCFESYRKFSQVKFDVHERRESIIDNCLAEDFKKFFENPKVRAALVDFEAMLPEIDEYPGLYPQTSDYCNVHSVLMSGDYSDATFWINPPKCESLELIGKNSTAVLQENKVPKVFRNTQRREAYNLFNPIEQLASKKIPADEFKKGVDGAEGVVFVFGNSKAFINFPTIEFLCKEIQKNSIKEVSFLGANIWHHDRVLIVCGDKVIWRTCHRQGWDIPSYALKIVSIDLEEFPSKHFAPIQFELKNS